MSASSSQQARRHKTGAKALPGKAGHDRTLYGVEMDVKDLRSMPSGTIPAGTKVVIMSGSNLEKFRAGFAKLGKSRPVRLKYSRRLDSRDDEPEATLEPIARIKEEAFQPGARARALLRGAEAIARDLEASGGTFDLDTVCGLTHLTRQGIHKRVSEGRLLAVPGPSNRSVYPVAQFRDDGRPAEGLKEVREALGTRSSWMLLNFLVNAEPRLNNRKPIDLLRSGRLDAVLEVARRVGAQGA